MCGLEEGAAAEAARTVGMPSGTPYYNPRAGAVNEQSEFDNPSWALYRYWLSQNPSFRPAQTSAELQQMLRELGFRPEVISLANFGETYLPHLDVRNWARQLAFGVYRQTASIPPMPQARL
ncbi:hypothetical protein C8Q74DRAFT_1224941 [Fomes fomentarius]|nr:hypothetical protein C8Q74DRAFT_1224941 [Fomes fomentarius]